MPKQGDTFINAVGVEVVAHGGSTPRPSVIKAGREGQAVNSANVAYDVFGRPYDPSEPVFMTTGTSWLIDRLSFTNAGRTGSPFGVLLDSFALKAYVDGKGWAIGPNEYGMPSAEWMDNNQQIVREYGLAPGFGFTYFVQMEGLVGGNVEAGSELSVSVVGNDPDVVIGAWSWVVDDVVVATTPTYTPLEADIGKTISCDTEATLLKYGTASTQEYVIRQTPVAPVITVVTNGTLVSGQTLDDLPPPTITVVNPGVPPIDMANFSEFRIVNGAAEPGDYVVSAGQLVQDRLSGPHVTGTVVITSTGFTVAAAEVAPVITVTTNGRIFTGQTLGELPPPTITVVNPGNPPVDMENFSEFRIVDGAAEPDEFVVATGQVVQDRLSGPHPTGTVVVTSTGFTVTEPPVADLTFTGPVTLAVNAAGTEGFDTNGTFGDLPTPWPTIDNGNTPSRVYLYSTPLTNTRVDFQPSGLFHDAQGNPVNSIEIEFVGYGSWFANNNSDIRYRANSAAAQAVITQAIAGGGTVEMVIRAVEATQMPVLGPFEVDGLEFYVRTVVWQVGFNIDDDAEPDIWITPEQLKDAAITQKAAIRQKLIDEGWESTW